MAKKSQDDDLVRTIVSTASTYLFEGIFGKINSELVLVLGKIEKRSYQIQERMLERVFSFLTLTLACLFVVLGVYSFMLEYMGLSNSAAYLIVGAALLVAYFLMNKRQRFGKKIEED